MEEEGGKNQQEARGGTDWAWRDTREGQAGNAFKCFVPLTRPSSYSLHLGHLLRTAGPKKRTSHSPTRGLTHLLVSLVGGSHLIYYPVTESTQFSTGGSPQRDQGAIDHGDTEQQQQVSSVTSCRARDSLWRKRVLSRVWELSKEQMKTVSPQPTTVPHLSSTGLDEVASQALSPIDWGGGGGAQNYKHLTFNLPWPQV